MSYEQADEPEAGQRGAVCPDLACARQAAFGVGESSATVRHQASASETGLDFNHKDPLVAADLGRYVYPLKPNAENLRPTESIFGDAIFIPAGTSPMEELKIKLGLPTLKKV